MITECNQHQNGNLMIKEKESLIKLLSCKDKRIYNIDKSSHPFWLQPWLKKKKKRLEQDDYQGVSKNF